ncbi:MAG: gamma-glutamyltransferase [Acidobacteria bacterium]|nr:gamma-glutamyltransferase [Acidobacteriota bacterium]
MRPNRIFGPLVAGLTALAALASVAVGVRTQKPPLHARQWMVVTGKPLAAVAGARAFWRGGNAVDAACASLAASCTLWDTLGWGGETQALVWHPGERRVLGVAALGVAPTGATPERFRAEGMVYPPEYGPLAAVTPGTPGGLLTMLAEWGRLPLSEVLAPAIELADGFAIEQQLAATIGRHRDRLAGWPFSRALFLPRDGAPPEAGEVFRQPDLARTLRRLVEAERSALAEGASRREAILAAQELFYRGALARELVAAARAEGALFTEADLAAWRPTIEPSVSVDYRGVEVHKLTVWTQGPAMLQTLNLLEPLDLQALGYNSAAYLHTIAQAMHLAFADRDFYYGDPAVPPEEPVAGLLSKAYARERWRAFDPGRNREEVGPGDPYPFQGGSNPFPELLRRWNAPGGLGEARPGFQVSSAAYDEAFRAGTTSVVAADAEGWVVSMTPSGAWVPAVVAGSTGIGLSQRMQSFVVEPEDGPYNVVAPGQRPRVTLTPTLALRDGRPWLAFAVQGGDTQDQNLLQFFLDVFEFGRTPQEAVEAANLTTYQMRSSFGDHSSRPGRLTLRADVPEWVRDDLVRRGYRIDLSERTSGPITAIELDREHGTLWGAASNYGEDTGIGW